MGLDRDAVRERVGALGLAPGDWLLFGSVPMLAHGLIPEVGDVDILARGHAWQQSATMGPVRRGVGGDQIVCLSGDVEVFDGWHGATVDGCFRRAGTIDGMLVASLGDVLDFKRRLARPKDTAHVQILERVLKCG